MSEQISRRTLVLGAGTGVAATALARTSRAAERTHPVADMVGTRFDAAIKKLQDLVANDANAPDPLTKAYLKSKVSSIPAPPPQAAFASTDFQWPFDELWDAGANGFGRLTDAGPSNFQDIKLTLAEKSEIRRCIDAMAIDTMFINRQELQNFVNPD